MQASTRFTPFVQLAMAASLTAVSTSALADTYQFKFLANPDALEAAPDKTLDVLHTVTIDTSKITAFNPYVLNATSSWLNGGIKMTMTHEDKTVSLNEGLDPTSEWVSIPRAHHEEGFLSLWPGSIWFFALEFAPDSPFIDGHNLPYDPFVYGFLFAYQDNKAYQDFSSLWLNGDTSVLSSYRVSAVPEPSAVGLALVGALGGLTAARRKRSAA